MNTKELCLGALFLGDASGYEIKQRFETTFSHFQKASFAAIYPALTHLKTEGLVSAHVEIQEKRPDKTVYSLTETGHQHFIDALHASDGAESFRSDFVLLMFFADQLSAEKVTAVLERQEQTLRQAIEALTAIRNACRHNKGALFTIDYGIAVKQASLTFIEQHKAAFTSKDASL